MKKILSLVLFILPLSISVNAQTAHSLDSIPENWTTSLDSLEEVDSIANWWKIFDDPVLNELCEEAVHKNLNIKIAIERIEQGRLVQSQAKAGFYPQVAFDIGASFSSVDNVAEDEDYSIFYNAGIKMNWEIDVFGRISKGVDAAEYSYQQAKEDKNSVMVSILSEVSSAYMRLRMFQNQVLVAEENIVAQQRALDIANDRFQSGVNNKLDVLQAQTLLYSTKASINTLQAQVISEINLIQIFLGEYPENLRQALINTQPLPEIPGQLQTLIPADVVRKRPDIRSAEKGMMALVSVEKQKSAEMLPTLAITGQVGFRSAEASEWFTSDGLNYFVGPTLRWDIFQGLYKKRDKQIAKVQVQQAQLTYKNTVITAFKEIENSLSNIKELKESKLWITETVTSSQEAFDLSMEQYQEGIIDYQPVLNSQQALLSSENSEVQTKANLLGQIINLYQSLGGNWVEED